MTPGDPSILSAEHDSLVKGLYDLRDRFKSITAEERLIVEAAIMMCEYLVEYATETASEEGRDLSSMEEIQTGSAQRAEARKKYPIHWTFEDFERLICSGGFELHDGRLVPRF